MNVYQPRARKRYPHHQHPFPLADDGELRIAYSRKPSFGRSTLSEDKDLPTARRLGAREYLLLLIEASMTLTAFVIRERNLTEAELARHQLTYRTTEINMLHYEGYSCLISLLIGCLADSYFKYYTLALLSVILHFAIMCMVAMEYTINLSLDQEDYQYEELMLKVCTAGLVLIKSTDFIRLVYGLEGMASRRHSTFCNFIFLHFWVSSSASYGGIFQNLGFGLFKTSFRPIRIASFVLCGISLFGFVIYLRPETQVKEQKGMGCKVVGCVLMAVLCKPCCNTGRHRKRSFFDHVEGTYSKITISRTQQLLLIYAVLLPSLGIALAVMIREDIFFGFHKIKIDDLPLGLTSMYRGTLLICMLLSYYAFWPLAAWMLGIRKRKYKTLVVKYLIGHSLVVGALFYIALWTRIVEEYPYTFGSGYVRIYNTARKPVRFTHADDFTMHDFKLGPEEGIMLSFPSPQKLTLFPMTVAFEGEKNLTTFLSVTAGDITGYMVVDPLHVFRIRGYLPLREGSPGTNKESKPRLYIYNTALTLNHALITIRHVNEKKTLMEVEILSGVMTVLALDPSLYDFRIHKAGLRASVTMKAGGVYGMMIYTVKTIREISIDTLVQPNTATPWLLFLYYIPVGLGYGLAYPSLRAVLYSVIPHGLPAMSFAFLAFLEGVALWISFVGFKTWHPFVNNTSLFLYASAMSVFFLMNIFCFMKARSRLPQ